MQQNDPAWKVDTNYIYPARWCWIKINNFNIQDIKIVFKIIVFLFLILGSLCQNITEKMFINDSIIMSPTVMA